MTSEEKQIESLLLKEWWSLIQPGLYRRAIKLYFNKIHGQVVNSSFVSENRGYARSIIRKKNDQ